MTFSLLDGCLLHVKCMCCLFVILSLVSCASYSSDMPGIAWSTERSSEFWSRRPTTLIARLPQVHQRNAERTQRAAQRDATQRQRRQDFVQRYRGRHPPSTPMPHQRADPSLMSLPHTHGEYRRMQHGYLAQTSSFQVTWSAISVEGKIHNLHPPSSRQSAQCAYELLMRSSQSRYRDFVQMRNSNVRDPFPYEIFSNPMFTAIGSHLYYNTTLCESTLEGLEARHSAKVAFQKKIFSPLIDYAISYELLHFQYDRALFKTITGAINTARREHSSPATSLQHKTFSPEY